MPVTIPIPLPRGAEDAWERLTPAQRQAAIDAGQDALDGAIAQALGRTA